jgi:hypothetical protein
MNWTAVAIAVVGSVTSIWIAVSSNRATRRTTREAVYVDTLTVLKAASAQIGLIATAPSLEVPDVHSAADAARVDALISVHASKGVREAVLEAARILGEFYGALLAVQTSESGRDDQGKLGGIADRYRNQLERVEALMRAGD